MAKKKLSKKQLRALAKGRRIAAANRRAKGRGYRPRSPARKRYRHKRTGLKRYGRNKGARVKVLTLKERRRRGRRRKRNPLPNPYRPRARGKRRYKHKRTGLKRYGRNRGDRIKVLTVKERRRRGRRRRKNPLPLPLLANPRKKSSGKRKRHSSKRSRAAKKGWARRRARARSKSVTPRKYRRRTKRAPSSKRSAAAKRGWAKRYSKYTSEQIRTRHKRRKKSDWQKRMEAEGHASERRRSGRRRHRRHHSRRKNPIFLPNPLANPNDWLSKIAGFAFGYALQDSVDRFAATHALTVDSAGVVSDTPPAGSIYDSEAPQLPIWSSWQRLAYNAAALAVPGIMGRFMAPEFFNHAFAAAAIRTIGKVVTDAIAMSVTSLPTAAQPLALQLYGGEVAANTRLTQAAQTPLAVVGAGVFAGVPRQLPGRPMPAGWQPGGWQPGQPRQLAAAPAFNQWRPMGDCGDGSMSPIMTDPLAGSSALTNQPMPSPSGGCGCQFNPLTAGGGPSDWAPTSAPPVQQQAPFTVPPVTWSPPMPPPAQTTTMTPPTGLIPPPPPPPTGPAPGCDANSIAQMQTALANANGTGSAPNAAQYNRIAWALSQCGVPVGAWTPPPSAPPTFTQPR